IQGTNRSSLWLSSQQPALRFKIGTNPVGSIEWNSNLLFYTQDNLGASIPTPAMTLTTGKRLGINIGATLPTQSLDVGGKIRLSNDGSTPFAGTMRYFNGSFSGYDGSTWKSFGLDGMVDGDGDTRIEFAESLQDMIHFVAGGDTMSFDGQTVQFQYNNTVVGKETLMDFHSIDRHHNAYFGYRTGLGNTRQSNNTYIGSEAGNGTAFATSTNTFVGSQAGKGMA